MLRKHLNQIWATKKIYSRMTGLRKAIQDCSYPFSIECIYGVGYRLVPTEGFTEEAYPATLVGNSKYTKERFVWRPVKVRV